MPHFTISFYLLLKVFRFLNTYYNNHYLRQFTELQVIILQDRKIKKKQKKQPYIKIPTQHYTAARSLQKQNGDFFFYWKSTKVFPELIWKEAVL